MLPLLAIAIAAGAAEAYSAHRLRASQLGPIGFLAEANSRDNLPALVDLRAALTRFLHPLTGGETGQGWDFGRIPRRSHLYRLLARFPGVHRVDALASGGRHRVQRDAAGRELRATRRPS